MEEWRFKKSAIFLLVLFLLLAVVFSLAHVFSWAQDTNLTPPPAINYAPNLWFDSEEQYYPVNPLDFYYQNGEEIPGQVAVEKYNQLSFQDKLNKLTVFYHILDYNDQWVYQYWLFYVFNDSLGLIKNKHYSDWEAVFVFVDKQTGQVIKVIGTAHQREIFDTEIYEPETSHVWTYIGGGSHANCIDRQDDGACDRKRWKSFEKWDKQGPKINYNNYNLIEIDFDFISVFKGAITFEKSPILEMNFLELIGIKQELFGIYDLDTSAGGSPPLHAWEQESFTNPDTLRPISRKLVAEYVSDKVRQTKDKVVGFFSGLVNRVKNVFQEVEPDEQQAGIVNLVEESVKEQGSPTPNKVGSRTPKISTPKISGSPVSKSFSKPEILEVVEAPEVAPEEEIILEEVEDNLGIEQEQDLGIEDLSENSQVLPPSPPAGMSFFPGGGGPSEEAPISTGDTTPPDSPIITSHNSGDIVTSTGITLIGTAESGSEITVSINPSYSTTTDESGNWQQIIELPEGQNTVVVVAKDSTGNQSQECSLDLIVDTTGPSQIIDLSAGFGNNRGEISLSWTAPGDDQSGSGVNQYIIRYTTSSEITSLNWASSTDIDIEPNPSSASSTESLLVSDLDASQTYYWAIKSEDEVGNLSEISNCASSSPQAQASSLVISEVQLNGANGANDEFIELYNSTDSAVDLSSWSIQYRGGESASFEKNNFVSNNSIPAYGFFLVANSSYDGYMQADMSHNSFQMSAVGGTVFLVNNQTLLTTGDEDSIVDKVAYGSGTYLFPENSEFASASSIGQSLERKNGATSTADLLAVNGLEHWQGNNWDSDNNSQDFVLQIVVNPQNSLSLIEPGAIFAGLADTAWSTLQHDLQHTGASLYSNNATGSPTTTPKWTVNFGVGVPHSPIIGPDNSLYLGAETGKFYKVTTVGEVSLFYDTGNNGNVEAVVISSDGRIYLNDGHHYLFAVDSSGQLIWKYPVSGASAPIISSGGYIYIASEYYLYKLNPNGEKIWQSPQLSNGRWIRSPVIDSNGNIYTVGRVGSCDSCNFIYSLNSEDGSINWTIQGEYNTALSLDEQGTLYVGGDGLYAINSFDGNQKWKAVIGDIDSSIPAIGDNEIYIGTDGGAVVAVNKSDGSINWQYGTGGSTAPTPIIDNQEVIYVGSQNNKFYALNSDGSLKWLAELSDIVQYGAVIGSDGTVYVASYDGTLYAFGE